ncbi:BRCA1 BRCA2-containing complex, subunit 3 [Podila minutissima]|uniref:BRCA1 BRCA2-containing complex, subunit 3 n=1 Tax=Podila minutissima TaxID=64525 RepID=A0A9P5STM3_9FUNG|nr:BRCA1 BRCA2-containing complex, subunit 3 [Podila minutissima]
MNRPSALSRVVVQSNVLHILLAHALSTEKEEIMGMLMGDWVKEGPTEIARVDGVSLLTRSEKRKDRVEIGPEQLILAAVEAEANKIQITCFQSSNDSQHIKLPFSVINENPLDSLTLPKLLEIPARIFDEQRQSFYKSLPLQAPKAQKTGAGGGGGGGGGGGSPFFKNLPQSKSQSQRDREGDVIMAPATPADTTATRQRLESTDEIPPEELNSKIIDIQSMTLPERMTMIRNSGVYVQSLTSLVDNLVGPTLQMLVDREQYNQQLLESLKIQKKLLQNQLSGQPVLHTSVDLVDLSDE